MTRITVPWRISGSLKLFHHSCRPLASLPAAFRVCRKDFHWLRSSGSPFRSKAWVTCAISLKSLFCWGPLCQNTKFHLRFRWLCSPLGAGKKAEQRVLSTQDGLSVLSFNLWSLQQVWDFFSLKGEGWIEHCLIDKVQIFTSLKWWSRHLLCPLVAAIMTIPVLLLLLLNSRPQTSRWTKGYINEKVNELPHEYPKYSVWKANNMLVVSSQLCGTWHWWRIV